MLNVLRHRRGAFSLIELVIVVLIIGILAAIAVPKMSRGAAAAADSALQSNLATIRSALELFQTEHAGVYPALADLDNALTQYSDAGATKYGAKDTAAGVIYGPYLRKVPPLPVGADRGKTSFIGSITAGNGWVYDATTGSIKANCPDAEVDARGVKYNTY
ncbi:MAG: type II secretion system protein [Planctomycetes bacterium]|nr:type II secretion system protein [Planctomycetota bacterium]